jgi:hypothetical protein
MGCNKGGIERRLVWESAHITRGIRGFTSHKTRILETVAKKAVFNTILASFSTAML